MQNQSRIPDQGLAQGLAAGAVTAPFTGLVRCTRCKSSRPMVIKALHPGVVSDNDRITYRCTACGAERTEPAK